MAQEQNKNIFAVPVTTGSLDDINHINEEIVIPTFDADTDVIQGLDDEPNDVGGLSAQELKAKFDQVGNSIKEYINGSFIPHVIGTAASEQTRIDNETARILNENERISAETARVNAENARSVFENYNSTKVYNVGNKVAYQGSSYRCKLQTTAGTLPTDTTYWDLIAEKGNQGNAAGFGTPTATAVQVAAGSPPTASVSASGTDTSKIFAFNFGIPKGDTGNAAGFGTPTATASQLPAGSQPTVSISASGTDESKVFAFSFGIPKGQDGEGTGDMKSSDYDRNQTVKNAGGIPTYVGMQVQDKSDKSVVLTGTLDADDWSSNAQTLTISGLATSGYTYTVAPDSSDFTKWAEAVIYADDVTATNQMTFHCETTPTEDIDVIILKVQVA